MSVMYLAKVNLNSKIFDIYENKLDLDTVLGEIYTNLNEGMIYEEESREEYIDKLGNIKKYTRKSKYQFAELQKEPESNEVITGKVVRTYNRPSENLNEETKEVSDTYKSENISIYFYFDVKNELITFCIRQAFGYIQFTNAFNHLLNLTIDKYGFEVFLQKDKDLLAEKLKELKKVNKIKATLIPPNANEDDLQEFRQSLGYINDCKESNATKYKLELLGSEKDDGLNIESKVIQDTVKAITKGYGDMNAYGVNGSGRSEIVKSNRDAAMTCMIDENIGKKEYDQEAKNFIARFLAKRVANNEKDA